MKFQISLYFYLSLFIFVDVSYSFEQEKVDTLNEIQYELEKKHKDSFVEIQKTINEFSQENKIILKDLLNVILLKTIFENKEIYLTTFQEEVFSKKFSFNEKHEKKITELLAKHKTKYSNFSKYILIKIKEDIAFLRNNRKIKSFTQDDLRNYNKYIKRWFYWIVKEKPEDFNSRANIVLSEISYNLRVFIKYIQNISKNNFKMDDKILLKKDSDSTFIEKNDKKNLKLLKESEKTKALKTLEKIE